MKKCIFFAVLFVMTMTTITPADGPTIDPLVLYKDLPPTQLLYTRLFLCDTLRRIDSACFYETDTGNVYDSNSITFNYQFTAGYAGYKIDWDHGATGFPLANYKGLVLAHLGPLPGHKVTVRWGYNEGCGSPTTFQTIGTFEASDEWKVDTIVLPDNLEPTGNYYEMQVLINNVDAGGSQTSPPGVLKLDDILLIKTIAGVTHKQKLRPAVMNSRSFTPSSTGPVMLSAFSLGGELLFSRPVQVVAGKRYVIDEFVKSNVCCPSSQIHCVKIKGAGVDLTKKCRSQ
ncbi:MAG: hypothetical protein JW768_11615 [Chitinispirillaceae bacterium]|nr:hypothetical protein [Chitinispirillaceae bacterium]